MHRINFVWMANNIMVKLDQSISIRVYPFQVASKNWL